jgi:hypothetical protein
MVLTAHRLTLMFLIAILLLALVIYVGAMQGRDSLNAGREDDLNIRAQLLTDSLDHTLQLRLTETFTFAARPSFCTFAALDELSRPARIVTVPLFLLTTNIFSLWFVFVTHGR